VRAAARKGLLDWFSKVDTDILCLQETKAMPEQLGPELKEVPDDYIREPWTMPARVQREVGCVLGIDYPKPIVDHAEARRRALERYRIG